MRLIVGKNPYAGSYTSDDLDVQLCKILQSAYRQLGHFQCYRYGIYVLWRRILSIPETPRCRIADSQSPCQPDKEILSAKLLNRSISQFPGQDFLANHR